MSAIVGYVGERPIGPEMVLFGLQQSEYRGYDSVGVAYLDWTGKLSVHRNTGRLGNLVRIVGENPPDHSHISIGHLRWATHGIPSIVNAHPHPDNTGKIQIVHNGIIENYAELKMMLRNKGYYFFGETDSEVLAKLIGDIVKELTPESGVIDGHLMHDAVSKTAEQITGSNAFLLMSTHIPRSLVAYCNEKPLYLAVSDGAFFIGSEAEAVHESDIGPVKELENGSIVTLSPHGFLNS